MEQEQKKSLLIIKGNPQSMLAAEGFLRNREWKIKSTSNLKEALIYLVQEQPSFVMISVDHPNKKVRNLPKVLAQAFPVCAIAFAEESSAASYKLLSSTATEYLIYPPITGPAIERTVNKYYKDQVAKTATADYQSSNNTETDENGNMIAIKGGGSFNSESAKNILAQMLSGDSADASMSGDKNSSSSNASFMQGAKTEGQDGQNGYFPPGSSQDANGHNRNAAGAGPAYRPHPGTASDSTSGPGYVPGSGNNPANQGYAPGSRPNSAASGMGMAPGPDPDLQGDTTSQGPSLSDLASALQQGNKGQHQDPVGHGIGAGKKMGYDPAQEDDSPLSNHYSRTNKDKGGAGWAPVEEKKKNKQRPGPETDDGNLNNNAPDSLILKGTAEALDKSCIRLSSDKVEAVDAPTNVACMVIESSRFSGYLVAAMGKDKIIDKNFIHKIQKRLLSFLTSNGEKVNENESLNLQIKQVPFEDWALNYAQFLRKSQHLGDEVAMAFFPRAEIKATFGESKDEDMASIKLDEFLGDSPVNFNVYVYLPKNSRYVLYTPRGGTLYNAQKDRLSSQGVSHLHILKAEMQDLDRYRAENFLNEKIDSYQAQEKIKKAV